MTKISFNEDNIKNRQPIAIVGMACRFPGGANSLDNFWELLEKGKDAIVEVPGHSVFFEVEVIVKEESEVTCAKNQIHKTCEDLNLHIFSDNEWFDHVDQMDREANKVIHLNNLTLNCIFYSPLQLPSKWALIPPPSIRIRPS